MKKISMVLAMAAMVAAVGFISTPASAEYKFSHFVILIDQSGDMNVNYRNESKNKIARDVAERMLNNIAKVPVPLTGAIYEYGIMAKDNENRVLRVQPWRKFDLDEFQLNLAKCQPQTGPSSLSVALRKLTTDIQHEGPQGWIAVFILSAGNFTDVETNSKVEERAKELKQAHPDLCIYTIQIGPNEKGTQNLEDVVKKGKCGYGVNHESLSTGLQVETYIRAIMEQQK